MALLRSLTTGISGLQNHQIAMDVIGDNLANVNTTGFKSGRVQFATMFSQTIGSAERPTMQKGGLDPQQIGVGMKTAEISHNFNQGALENTGVKSDLGIDGEGFFVLDSMGQNFYTRDGAFELGLKKSINDKGVEVTKRTLIHKGTGLALQGQIANTDGSIDAPSMGALDDINIPLGELQLGKATENAFFMGNLNSAGQVSTTGTRSFSAEFFSDPTLSTYAHADTDIGDLYTSDGLLMENHKSIDLSVEKGGRKITNTFVYGKNKNGTTLGDLALFMQRMAGLHTDNTMISDNAIGGVGIAKDAGGTVEEVNVANTGSSPSLNHNQTHDEGVADNDGVNETRLQFGAARPMNTVENKTTKVINANTFTLTDNELANTRTTQGNTIAYEFNKMPADNRHMSVQVDLDNNGSYETTAEITDIDEATGKFTINTSTAHGLTDGQPVSARLSNSADGASAQFGINELYLKDGGTSSLAGHVGNKLSVTANVNKITISDSSADYDWTVTTMGDGDSIYLSGADITDGWYNIKGAPVTNQDTNGDGHLDTVITLDRDAGTGSVSDLMVGNVISYTDITAENNYLFNDIMAGDNIAMKGDGALDGMYQVLDKAVDSDGDGVADSIRLGFKGASGANIGDNAFSGVLGKETDITYQINPNKLYVNGNLGTKNEISNWRMTSGNTTWESFSSDDDVAADGESTTSTLTVFDSQGGAHSINMVATRIDTKSNNGASWRWYADAIDDDNDLTDDIDPDIAVGSGTMKFDNLGDYLGESNDRIKIDLDNGQATQLIIDPDFAGMNQRESSIGASELDVKEQDGLERGILNNWSISGDGTVVAVYSNGLTKDVARIAVTTFRNNNGLVSTGSNLFRDDLNTGGPRANVAGQNEAGNMRSFTLESSNVDLSLEFTKMITTQRGFQANARTITTSDEMLTELVNLKR